MSIVKGLAVTNSAVTLNIAAGPDLYVPKPAMNGVGNTHMPLLSRTALYLVASLVGVDEIGRAHVWNSSHVRISYAVFCLKKKKITGTALIEHTRGSYVIDDTHL